MSEAFRNSSSKTIADNSTVYSYITVTDDVCIADLDLAVNITHTYIGDLIVDLAGGVAAQALHQAGAQIVAGHLLAGDADDAEFLRQEAGLGEIVERRHQQAPLVVHRHHLAVVVRKLQELLLRGVEVRQARQLLLDALPLFERIYLGNPPIQTGDVEFGAGILLGE